MYICQYNHYNYVYFMKLTILSRLHTVLLVCLILFTGTASAAPHCTVTRYDENNGLSQWRVTQMLQDKQGIIWFATWNGLNRFDGYEFKCFKVSEIYNKAHADTAQCIKTDDRIRNIWLSDEGYIYCKSDEGYYQFNTHTYSFHDIPGTDNETLYNKLLMEYKGFWLDNLANGDLHHTDANGYKWTLTHGGRLYYEDKETKELVHYPLDVPMQDLRFGYSDKQGNLWIIFTGGVYKFSFIDNSIIHLEQEHPTHVRCTFVDSKMRYWVTGRNDNSVRIYNANNQLLGYLGSDGRLHKQHTPFKAPVYCITQSCTGDIWMGSKPGGIFRLKENTDGIFSIDHYRHDPADPYSLSHNDVYDIKEDVWSRLWIATLGGGINCLPNSAEAHPRFIHKGNELAGYPKSLCNKVRNLHLTGKGVMIAATTEGLLVAQLPENGQYRQMKFNHHVKQPYRPTSLSCSAIMDILQDSYGHIFISTENGGINQLITNDLLADTLKFKHFNTKTGLPSDVTLMMTEHEGCLWVVCTNQICVINPYEEIISSFDANFFQRNYRFSEAIPLQLPDGRWLFGLHDGAFTLSTDKMRKSEYVPLITITEIAIQNKTQDMSLCNQRTLTLQPHERNLTIHFAAIDYTDAGLINYAFRLNKGEADPWNYIGKSRSITLLDLKPGKYELEIRSTNADGVWVENTHTITLIVIPTFWETGWAILLYVLLGVLLLGIAAYTYIYIQRIKRQQHETLEAYLALLNKPNEQQPESIARQKETSQPAGMSEEDNLFMHRIMDFIEAHMADADINVGDMAEAAATSRSGLNRKLKSILGVTPLDLLREARIKRACQLLECNDLNVSEVAYRCGFSDPKYFSRCFKQTVGVSPTEYKRK